jgi:hypothetical protein
VLLALTTVIVRPAPAWQGSDAALVLASQTEPTPRPDLTVTLGDLPSGYEEVPGLDLMLFDTPLIDRVLRRIEPGAGPDWVMSSTYQVLAPVTQNRVDFLANDLTVFLTRSLADEVTLNQWTLEDSSALGEMAKAYSFAFAVPARELRGDGALALVGRDAGYVSLVIVLNVDGDSVSDLHALVDIVNARIDAEQGSASSS